MTNQQAELMNSSDLLNQIQKLSDIQEQAFWFNLWGRLISVVVMDGSISQQEWIKQNKGALEWAKTL